MSCGPGTILDADPRAHRLRCPRCGAGSWLPALPLFVVTGASGSGKTTITGPLRRLLPGCLVLETDVILHVAALGWDTWRNTWLQLTHAAEWTFGGVGGGSREGGKRSPGRKAC